MTLQEGIYLERGVPPPPAWRMVFLDLAEGTRRDAVHDALARVVDMLRELQQGRMRDLAGAATVRSGTFTFLLGYGASFFAAPVARAARPRHLVALRRDGPAFPSLPWSRPGAAGHGGESDLVVQLTGVSRHAVDRAAVEIATLIGDLALPLRATGTYDGFQRDDGRSWIGFHDGVSNIEPSQRRAAVTCPGDPGWNRGGTYLAFLRLQVDLGAWRALSVAEQEAIVGRAKSTGCPLGSGQERPPGDDAPWEDRDAYYNPPETGDPAIELSHIHRVNQNRAAGTTHAGHRIFRQGYEYLEDITAEGPRLGLNFVSFQSDLEQLQQVLGLAGWLGDVNFGGPGGPGALSLMSLRAGGFYAVPPRAEPFAGAALLSG